MIEMTQGVSALLLGLAGTGHCLGMCGGIAVALNLSDDRTTRMTLAYHAGRIVSYTLLGALAGFAVGSIEHAGWAMGLRYLAGVLLITMGLYIAEWWRGMTRLEQVGAIFWRPVQRLSSALLPLNGWPQGFALGLCWGMMPCGLIYSSLAWAATAQDAALSGMLMMLFGLGTLPAMLTASMGAGRLHALLQKRNLKLAIALLLCLAGLWTMYSAATHGDHATHMSHTG